MDHDLPQYLRVIAAFVFVLALMGGFMIFLRKIGYAQSAPSKRRLKLIEILHIDSKRKVAILQRDSRQHLVIFGPQGETLIESGIESDQDVTT